MVISHRLWQQAFRGDPALIDTAVMLDGQRHLVARVMPPGFQFLGMQVDVWSPLTIRETVSIEARQGF